LINILIIDDHPVVRRGIIQFLRDDPERRFGSIEEAGNGGEMIDKLISSDFDIILLDNSMPGRSGLELIQDIKNLKPDLPVLMLSIYPEEQYAIRAMKMGASGYLNKGCSPEELISAIVKITRGGRYISLSLADKLAHHILSESNKPLHETLSVRELQVLLHLASGKKVIDISRELSLSPKTISTYRTRILSKLNLRSTSDIIRYAFKEGLSD